MGRFSYFSELKRTFKLKNFINYFVIIAVIAVLSVLSISGGVTRSTAYLFEQIGYSIIAALALSLVVGFLGELSLGHAAFMSLGAYFGVYLQNTVLSSLASSSPLLALIVALIVGGLIAALFGFIIGLPALRLKGDYLAIVTLAFGEIVKVIFQNIPAFGAAIGLTNSHRYSYKTLFIIIFVFVLITLIIVQNFIRSKHGRAVTAIRDNEIAARAMGVNVTKYKLIVFVLSAFIAGIAGVLMGAASTQITPTTYDYNYSINILVMVVLGGMGSINGSMIAATVITFINIKLQSALSGDMAVIKNLIYALILIVIVIYTNSPALKGFRSKYNLRKLYSFLGTKIKSIFSKKKKGVDPAIETENGQADWTNIPTKIEMDAILSTDFTPDKTYTPDKPDKGGKK